MNAEKVPGTIAGYCLECYPGASNWVVEEFYAGWMKAHHEGGRNVAEHTHSFHNLDDIFSAGYISYCDWQEESGG